MKNKLLLAALALLNWQFLPAQIAFSSADMPATNTVIEESEVDSASLATANLGSAGANQTWNFSNLTVYPYPEYTYYHDTVQAPYLDMFPGANLTSTYENSDTAEYTFYLSNQQEFSQMGAADPTYYVKYDQPLQYFKFPFTYLTTINQSTGVSGESDGTGVFGTISTNAVADAYGTVTTPLGTFNCLRVKRITELNLTVFIFSVIQRDTVWEWWTKKYAAPVFSYDSYYSSFLGQEDSGSYGYLLTAQSVADKEPVKTAAMVDLQLAPNPTSGATTLRFNLPGSGPAEIMVLNAEGKIVRQEQLGNRTPGPQTVDLDLSNAVSGSYYLMLRQRGKMLGIKQLVKN